MKKIIINLVVLIILLSGCNIYTQPPKLHKIKSIINKGIVVDKNIIYPNIGILTIQTDNDIVKEEIGKLDIQPNKYIFRSISIGDTIK